MKKLTLVDTFGFLFRSFFALPPLKSSRGRPVSVLMGFVNLIMQLHKDCTEQYLIFALESKEENLRKKIDINYKATRPDAPPDLVEQIPIVIEWIEKMGLIHCFYDGYEADDIIATLAKYAYEEGFEINIISHDKDFYQLINDRIFLYNPIKKTLVKREDCFQKYGVYPEEFVDFQSIMGDNVDNVPGIKGIGAKGAKTLIRSYHSLDNIYNNIQDITPVRTQNLLIEGKESAFLSRELVRLKQDIPLKVNFEESLLTTKNPLLKIIDDLQEYDFKRVLSRLLPYAQPTQRRKKSAIKQENAEFSTDYELIQTEARLFEVLRDIQPDSLVSFDTETTSLEARQAQIVGFSFALDSSKGYYVPISHYYIGVGQQISKETAKKAIEQIFNARVIGHNLKFDLEVLRFNFDFMANPKCIIDTMILAWLIDSSQALGLDFLAKKWFSHTMIAFSQVVPKKGNFSEVHLDDAAKYAAEDAQATFKLYEQLLAEVQKQGLGFLLEIAKDVEYPFICVLQKIEEVGIKINVAFFEQLKEEINVRILNLSEEIYRIAQCNFNLNSHIQLGGVLFDKLKLPILKKTKTSVGSTDETVLATLLDAHPIIKPILEYRELYKLQSTYIQPFLDIASQESDCRIHTSFLQTGTTTGRLSSRNPNLQNIPVRTDLGRRIREGFIAKEGYALMSLDYSQIELRLLAHFSKDKTMIDAFLNGADIHYETAKMIFTESLAMEKRQVAKSINFGLIYGMGARKLSETLKISLKEARNYIQYYFDSFPTVKSFLNDSQELIMQCGYSQTLLGRRRIFDFKNATPFQTSAYLREAINTIFQGSAADLIKLAMLQIDTCFKETELKMLLQIHDELVFEVREDLVDSISKEVAHMMENIYPLNVPLICGVTVGKNWGELK
ncbi:DNA polymerase I [Helicobacter monodelphidis]|uniref:DNA polymerase I n=1 Tax=Helicobacter sp. 15-1451 TaxID=2004995 RepID=UPI000DCDD9CC|nr:DNA polymerase I [Helicobacter sp. 15-1451]RAX58596.1 DNA polymerase I [Helicobacter sp. 15-1451]